MELVEDQLEIGRHQHQECRGKHNRSRGIGDIGRDEEQKRDEPNEVVRFCISLLCVCRHVVDVDVMDEATIIVRNSLIVLRWE